MRLSDSLGICLYVLRIQDFPLQFYDLNMGWDLGHFAGWVWILRDKWWCDVLIRLGSLLDKLWNNAILGTSKSILCWFELPDEVAMYLHRTQLTSFLGGLTFNFIGQIFQNMGYWVLGIYLVHFTQDKKGASFHPKLNVTFPTDP